MAEVVTLIRMDSLFLVVTQVDSTLLNTNVWTSKLNYKARLLSTFAADTGQGKHRSDPHTHTHSCILMHINARTYLVFHKYKNDR